MAEVFEGVVTKLTTKTNKPGAKRKWTLYSFQLDGATWITFGFDKGPPFEEGDSIHVEAQEDDNGYLQYVEGTGRILSTKSVGGGSTASANDSKPAGGANSASVGTGGTPAVSAGATKREAVESDRQHQIVNQHSQEMAIAMVGLLLQHDGLPMTTSKTKASQAQRFEEITAAVDKFTVKFANDVYTDRVKNTVADMGVVSVTAKDNIPAADKKEEKSNTSGDDY